MPFPRPTLAELDAALQADIQARLPGTDPRLRRSYLGVLARTLAGGLHEAYGFLQWIAEAAFPDTAEGAELRRWAAIWGVEPIEAVQATGSIAVTGTTDTIVDEDTLWRSGAGLDYESTAEATLVAGAATIPVRAVKAGKDGNAAVAVKMSTVSPIAGLVAEASVSVAIAGGADAESDDALRERLLLRVRAPPRGGTVSDYELWSLAAHADVSRAWARGNTPGLGQVTVYFMTDDATANGIPDAATVDTVQDYVDERRPVTAAVTVAAPTAVGLDVTITDIEPDNAAVRAAVEAELQDLVLRESEPGGTILVSHIREAISTAPGETSHTLTAPVADVAHEAGEIAVLGAVTFT